MRLPSHLRLSRHGVWCFRLVLPDVLAAVLGQKEIRRSLGTRCPITAKIAAYRLSGRILPIIRETKRMAFDPNSLDPDKVRELITRGLVIDKRTGTITAEYLETNNDPEIAKLELAALAAMAEPAAPSPEVRAYLDNERAMLEASCGSPTPGNPSTLGQAVADFLDFKGNLAKGSLTTYEYRLKMFVDLVGGPEKMLHQITRQHCIKATEAAQSMAPHATQRGKDRQGEGRISASTVKDMLILWQSFFDWAISYDRYAGENPVAKIKRPSDNNAKRGAAPFRPDELARIFQPQLFAVMKRPHQYWGPLLGLFTGARSNELAQLRVSDFIKDGDLRCIRIEHDPTDGTRLKNAASNRVLPLHPTLWAIGLGDYLDDLKEIGADRLFPNLPADKHGKREKYLSRDFNENLLGKLDMRQARVKVFHSFRDTMASKLAAACVHYSHIADWLGHARQGTEGNHYIATLTPVQQAATILPLLDFGVDFSGFKYESGRWNDWLCRNMVD